MRAVVTEVVESGEKRDERGRRITPPEQRAAIVRAFRTSGLTAAAFARREGLKYQTFAGWVHREDRDPGRAPRVRFAPVSLPAVSAASAAALEVRLPDGTLVRGSDAHELAELVRALRD